MVLVEPSEAQTKALVRVQYKDSVWYPAHIIEVSGANEDGHPTHVKIHYGNSNKRYDEWLALDAGRVAWRDGNYDVAAERNRVRYQGKTFGLVRDGGRRGQ